MRVYPSSPELPLSPVPDIVVNDDSTDSLNVCLNQRSGNDDVPNLQRGDTGNSNYSIALNKHDEAGLAHCSSQYQRSKGGKIRKGKRHTGDFSIRPGIVVSRQKTRPAQTHGGFTGKAKSRPISHSLSFDSVQDNAPSQEEKLDRRLKKKEMHRTRNQERDRKLERSGTEPIHHPSASAELSQQEYWRVSSDLKSLINAREVAQADSSGQATPRSNRNSSFEPHDRAGFYKVFSMLVRVGENNPSAADSSVAHLQMPRKTSLSALTRGTSHEKPDLVVVPDEYLFLHLQAWMAGKCLTKSVISDSLKWTDEYLVRKRLECRLVFDEIKNFRYRSVFDMRCMEPSCNPSAAGSVSLPTSLKYSVPDVSSSDLPALEVIQPSCETADEQFTTAFLERQRDALLRVGALLDKLDACEGLYRNLKAMREHQAAHFDVMVQDRLKVLYVWYNISRDLCRKTKHIGLMLGMDKPRTCDAIDWPNLDYESPCHSPEPSIEDDVADDDQDAEAPSVQMTIADADASAPTTHEVNRSSSAAEITSTAAVYKQYVEKSLRRRGMRKVLSKISDFIGKTLFRARQALEVEPLPMSAEAQCSAAPVTRRLRVNRLSRSTGTNKIRRRTASGRAVTEPVTPDTVSESKRLRTKPPEEPDAELRKYGTHSTEFKQMCLPSFQPSYLFLLRIPLHLVQEWLRLRLEQRSVSDGDDRQLDPMALKQLIQDCQDVLESAVNVKRFYQEHVTAVTHNMAIQHKLLVEGMLEYEDDLAKMYELYLTYVCEWVNHLNDASGESGRGLLTALEKEWKFAKRIGIHIQDGEVAAAKRFCGIAAQMIESVSTYLDEQQQITLDNQMRMQTEEFEDPNLFEVDRPNAHRRPVLEFCRSLREKYLEARERAVRALGFIKLLRNDLEITAHYKILDGVNDTQLLHCMSEQKLKLVEIEGLNGAPQQCVMFVPAHVVADGSGYLELLLNTTCGRSVDENPEMEGRCGYLLLLNLSNKKFVRERWDGDSVTVSVDSDTRASLNHVKVFGIQLVVVNSAHLKSQRRELQNVFDKHSVELVDEQCSCHMLIDDCMSELKKKASGVRKRIASWLESLEEQLFEEENDAHSYRDTMVQAYNFAFEYHRELVKLISGPRRKALADSLRTFALQFTNFVVRHSECGKGIRPRWAKTGIDFLVMTVEPKYSSQFAEDEFIRLKDEMNRCLVHLIGSPQQQPKQVESSKSWSPQSVPEIEFDACDRKNSLVQSEPTSSRQLSAVSTMPGSKSNEDVVMGVAPKRRVMKSIKDLENTRENLLRDERRIGHAVERSTVAPAAQLCHKRANFRWQRLDKRIGRGASGDVYTALNLDTNAVIAVKCIDIAKKDHRVLKTLVDEITNFEGIQHNHLVRYYGVEVHKDEVLIFMEYCSEGTLESVCKEGLAPELVRYYTLALLYAVLELHRRGIIHRDIKTANIFLTTDKALKLGDFGCSLRICASRTLDNEVTGFVGTYPYMAPEIACQGVGGRASDIWSVGCVVLEMASGKPPFHGYASHQIIYQVGLGNRPPIADGLSASCKDFLDKCLQQKPEKRWTVEQLLEHEFVKVSSADDGGSLAGNSFCRYDGGSLAGSSFYR